MALKCPHKRFIYLVYGLLFFAVLSACSTIAPVQEMSNARQSIRAAKDVNAHKLATNVLSEAEQRLNSATRELDAGEYEKARVLALEAKHLALKARQLATNNKAIKVD